MCEECKESDKRKVLKRIPLTPKWKKLWAKVVALREAGKEAFRDAVALSLSQALTPKGETPRELIRKARLGDRLKAEFSLEKCKFYEVVEEDLPLKIAANNMTISDDDKTLIIYAD